MGRPKKKSEAATKKSKAAPLKMKMKSTRSKKVSIKVHLQKVSRSDSDSSEEEDIPKTKPKHPYQMYSQEDLIAAVKAVREDGMSTYKAAEMYGVPKSTVHDKVAGKSNLLFQRKGPAPLLSYEDEKKLVDYLLQMSSLGYMFTIAELRNLASELAVEKGKLLEGTLLSPRWHKSFRTRWPILNEKVFGNFRTCDHKKNKQERRKTLETFEFEEDGDQIQISTLADETDICLSNYFTELHILMVKYELLDKPQRIFCLDEVAIQYESGNPKAKQINSLRHQVSSRTETTVVSLIGCGNALGNALPPFLIYPGRHLSDDMLRGRYPGVQGTVTENGLTDYSTMKHYLENHFIEYALLGMKKNPPVVVLYDGTKSKVNPDTIAWAKNRNIILFVLPPNSSNLTLPLERGCFRYFKDHFLRETRVYRELYNVDSISKTALCRIVSEAYPQAMSMKNLVDIFEESGIHPYKPSIVLSDELRNERLERKNKLNAITKRPPGMRDKGIQVTIKDDSGSIKLIKSGRRKIYTQEDGTVTDADSTSTFLRDKKIQKMLESNSSLARKRDESDFTESEDDFDDELEDENQAGVQPPVTSTYYFVQDGPNGNQVVSQPITTNAGTQQYATTGNQHFKMEGSNTDFKIEDAHAYAMNPAGAAIANSQTQIAHKVDISEIDTMEQTRVAVQALQEIANEIQIVSTTSLQNNGNIQNVTLNSGRMIQVMVQDHPQIVEHVEQIEIDNSVESIIPMAGDVIENA